MTYLDEMFAKLERDERERPLLEKAVRAVRFRGVRWRDEARYAVQRVRRGWDERAYWDSGGWLARNFGDVLIYTSSRLHGYPDHTPFEEWRAQHLEAGLALKAWADTDPLDVSDAEYLRLRADAQDALRWAADHLDEIWD